MVHGVTCDSLSPAAGNLVEAIPKVIMSRHMIKYDLLGITFFEKIPASKIYKGL